MQRLKKSEFGSVSDGLCNTVQVAKGNNFVKQDNFVN